MTMPPLRETAGIPLDQQGRDDWLSRLADGVDSLHGTPLVTSHHLPPVLESPKIARGVTKLILFRWRLGAWYEDAAVVVSELVTNAVRHGMACDPAADALRLVLARYAHHLACAVTDPADTAPRMREPDYIAETGRGLHIVQAMSRAWGWTPLLGGGKAVWATFAID